MKNSVIRIVIVLATISILGIAVTQVYWFKRAFDLNEEEFDRNVNSALYRVAYVLLDKNTMSAGKYPIERLSSNYYVVTINTEIDAGMLENLLREELQKRNILEDFEYGIYDCNNNRMVYCNYVANSHTLDKELAMAATTLPESGKQQFYFGVYFPNKEFQIVNRMGIWLFSSIVLIVVIMFFSYTTFAILRQKRLSEIQKDFIDNITHEFKTPISTIAVSSEVLKQPNITATPNRVFSYATIIHNETNRLRSYVDKVLQVAMVDDEEISLKKEKFHFHDVIGKAIEIFNPKIEELKGVVHVDLAAKDDVIYGDKFHITNMVCNLLDNAVKYGNENELKVEVRTFNEGTGIVLKVTDNGAGISKNEQQKIFNKFYRTSTGNVHDVKGFGLGLYYVKLMVQQHQGKIDIESEQGNGSTFILELPLGTNG